MKLVNAHYIPLGISRRTRSEVRHFRRKAREHMNAEWLQWELGAGGAA